MQTYMVESMTHWMNASRMQSTWMTIASYLAMLIRRSTPLTLLVQRVGRHETPPQWMEADAIADLVIKKMNEMFKPAVRAPEPPRFQKPYQCGICHGDHPTFQCALKPRQLPQFQNKLWCDYEKRWTNHNTEGCWQPLKLLREQDIAQQNQGNFWAGGEKAMPVLGQQPPLPGRRQLE